MLVLSFYLLSLEISPFFLFLYFNPPQNQHTLFDLITQWIWFTFDAAPLLFLDHFPLYHLPLELSPFFFKRNSIPLSLLLSLVQFSIIQIPHFYLISNHLYISSFLPIHYSLLISSQFLDHVYIIYPTLQISQYGYWVLLIAIKKTNWFRCTKCRDNRLQIRTSAAKRPRSRRQVSNRCPITTAVPSYPT